MGNRYEYQCRTCPHAVIYPNPKRQGCAYCEHPDKQYILTFCKKYRMTVGEPCRICYTRKMLIDGKITETIPIKTSPHWCPRKMKIKVPKE
jgi:hypothetical protein